MQLAPGASAISAARTRDRPAPQLPHPNAMEKPDNAVMWTFGSGIRCVLIPYDEDRYQLKLMREEGTIKTDLFSGYASALAAAREWLRQVRVSAATSRE